MKGVRGGQRRFVHFARQLVRVRNWIADHDPGAESEFEMRAHRRLVLVTQHHHRVSYRRAGAQIEFAQRAVARRQ